MQGFIKNICCIGAGYVGGPTMAVIADKCPEINIYVVDKNESRIDSWNSSNFDDLPVYEPGLKEILKRVRNKNLFFSADSKTYIKQADAIFISVNTPVKTSGLGAGQASNLRWVESCTREIAELAEGHTIVIEKSTLPVKTAEIIKEILNTNVESNESCNKTFSILSNPEFLAEGTAIKDLESPDRVLIGGDDKNAIEELKNLYKNWVDGDKILTTNLWSSELSKLAANAFLAQRISSINAISALCESTGANVDEVSKAIGLDNRIGKEFLKSGPGFGGSCFKKDISNLVYLSRSFGLNEVADFWEQVIFMNNWQQKRIYKLIVNELFGNVVGKRLVVLGFAFKANTNDVRESPSIQIVKNLLTEGANLIINDPKVTKEQISSSITQFNINSPSFHSSHKGIWNFESDLYKAFKDADAIIILTEWESYKEIDWAKASKLMRSPGWVFDARSILNRDEIVLHGLKYWGVGQGDLL